MTERFQFTLRSAFLLIVLFAILATIARLGHVWLALFLAGSIVGSIVPRTFAIAVLCGSVGGAIGLWLALLIAVLMHPGMLFKFGFGCESVGAMIYGGAGGAVVGAFVRFVKFLAHNPSAEIGGPGTRDR
jgi:hypothetical protein